MLKEHGHLLFCADVFVGCSEGEVRTWSILVVAWHSYVYGDGGGDTPFDLQMTVFFNEVGRKSANLPPYLSRNAVSILNGVNIITVITEALAVRCSLFNAVFFRSWYSDYCIEVNIRKVCGCGWREERVCFRCLCQLKFMFMWHISRKHLPKGHSDTTWPPPKIFTEFALYIFWFTWIVLVSSVFLFSAIVTFLYTVFA